MIVCSLFLITPVRKDDPMRKLQQALTPPMWAKWLIFFAAGLFSGLVWALLARLIDTQSAQRMLFALSGADLWLTALFLGLALLVLSLLTHSLLAGNLIVGLAAVILALIDHYKMAITSTPLQIGDFSLAGRLGSIVRLNAQSITFSAQTVAAIAVMALWLALAWFFSRPLRLSWKWSLPAALAPALVLFLIFWVGADRLIFTPLQVPLDTLVTQSAANERCGVLLGLWRSARGTTQVYTQEYSQETMEALLAQAREELSAGESERDRERPNIILILSESFFDVTTLPGVTYDGDPLAEFHALQEEGVSGTFYSRTVGYGTCNIELEILTGINTSLLSGENLYSMDPELFTRLPTVPGLLRENGYETIMFHLFDDSIYNRTPIFQAIGFDQLYFSGDFAAIDPDAAEADYWAYMAEQVSGGYYSDSYMTDLFIDLYEQQGADGPLFLYGISMENHTPHDGTKYADDGYTVAFTSPLSGEAAGVLADVSQGAANASAALGRLADYFREQEEPTVILFFGDHRPGLGLSDNVSSVYSALDMIPGSSQSQWTAEQLAELHSTSYLIWSNDPDYLPAPAGSEQAVSCNYFGLSVLDAADVSLPLYWRLLKDVSSTRIIDTVEYHLGRDGVPSAAADADPRDTRKLNRLALCFHDALYGDQYITEELWE